MTIVRRTLNSLWVHGDYREYLPRTLDQQIGLIIADPVYDTDSVNECWRNFVGDADGDGIPTIIFSSMIDATHRFGFPPEQFCTWNKPVSTKNTVKNYSQFTEAITFWNGVTFESSRLHCGSKPHWSMKISQFNDRLFSNEMHPWRKPESLIQRLIMNHWDGESCVYDPFAGSGVVGYLCERMGVPCVSIESDKEYIDKWR